jgi:hypothetical protein
VLRRSRLAAAPLALAAAPLALAGLLASPGPAAAAPASAAASAPGVPSFGCQRWTGGPPPSPGSVVNQLSGVTVVSPCSAWAVGFSADRGPDQVLIEHWDGADWTTQPGQNPGRARNRLLAVSATSASDVWAVGRTVDGSGDRGLIEHWNGTAWSVSPFTPPGRGSALRGVAAVSPGDVWAVGEFSDGHGDKTLIEHWNGTRWTQVPSPNPGAAGDGSLLSAVSAASRHEAWAVGRTGDGRNHHTLILHWNGVRWSPSPSPCPGRSNMLSAVTIIPGGGAWAVGRQFNGTAFQTLILRWTGLHWLPVPSPNPGGPAHRNELLGVTATSPFSAWAVGDDVQTPATGAEDDTLILHWNGRSWAPVSSPQPGDGHDRVLAAVAASTARDVWAAGGFEDGNDSRALAIHSG